MPVEDISAHLSLGSTCYLSPSGDSTGLTDITNINNALAAFPAVFLLPGGYTINAAIAFPSQTTLIAIPGTVTITQTSTTANGITGTDVSNITLIGFALTGPGSGSGNGIKLSLSADDSTPYLDFQDLTVSDFGSNGISIDTAIVSSMRRIVSKDNGGDGFYLHTTEGGGTSVSFQACYAAGNSVYGYQLQGQSYSALTGCASDSNTDGGYFIGACKAVNLTGCGAESNSGPGFTFSAGSANSAESCSVSDNTTIAFKITSSEAGVTLVGPKEISATDATAFISTGTSCSAVTINAEGITSNSFTTGTAYTITATGGTTH